MGHLIPAGSGFWSNRDFEVEETERPSFSTRDSVEDDALRA